MQELNEMAKVISADKVRDNYIYSDAVKRDMKRYGCSQPSAFLKQNVATMPKTFKWLVVFIVMLGFIGYVSFCGLILSIFGIM